jgi:hypothetical protein
MEFREDKRKYRRNGLEDECKGKDGEVDNGENYPAVSFKFFTFFQVPLTFHLILLPLTPACRQAGREAGRDFIDNDLSQTPLIKAKALSYNSITICNSAL